MASGRAMIGAGRNVTIWVLAAIAAVSLALAVVVAELIVQGGPLLYERWRGHIVPPPDPARAMRPASGNVGALFTADDYPPDAIRRNEQGRTVARLAIDAAGWPTRCVVVVSSGSHSLDAATCAIGMRARLSPTRDADGRAIPGSFTLPVRWVLPRS